MLVLLKNMHLHKEFQVSVGLFKIPYLM